MCGQIKKARGLRNFSSFRVLRYLLPETAFTLMELIAVLVIIAVLATIGISQFYPLRENAFEREAEANLRLIAAGERIWRMEAANAQYRACINTATINTDLRLSLPRTNPAWSYFTRTYAAGTTFCAQATRIAGARAGSYWVIRSPTVAIPDPIPQSSHWTPPAVACP
jgi:prepilin-type N-terminal cleavage/methylation domain-containing protein